MFTQKIMHLLEFDEVLLRLSDFAVSEPSRKAILQTVPADSFREVAYAQQCTREAYDVQYKYLQNPIVQFDDITEILAKAKAGAMLQMGELLKTARMMRSARIAKKDIVATGDDIVALRQIIAAVFIDTSLEDLITQSIASDSEMRDDASDTLKTIRRRLIATNNKLKDKLQGYTRSGEYSKYLQDNLVTVRMGRFVLPVKSECRSQVPGLLHDQSASGSTVYIEPFPIVELNNELKLLQLEEQQEIERILLMLSSEVANQYQALKYAQHQCIMLDIIFAKCHFSVKINGSVPILNEKGIVDLKQARHPLIDPTRIVPVDVSVGRDCKMLIVTGPNTGGKTVCLKTVGLCSLMAFSGLWIPCESGSEVAVFDNIFCDLGDEQSIEHSLSTFSAHIVNIIRITEQITPKSLVLMDELGAGTDPVEGAALSIGIIRFLEQAGATGIITTHFSELKEYALLSPNLKNACMQFDEATLRPTYKLIVGIPGTSNALEIAKSLGLNQSILVSARESIRDEKVRFEEVIRSAERAKSEALLEAEILRKERILAQREREAIEKEHEKLSEKLERITQNAKSETRSMVRNMLIKADEMMFELKQTLKAEDENALRKARQLRNNLERIEGDEVYDTLSIPYEDLPETEVKIGTHAVIKSLRSEATIQSLPDRKGEVRVRAGNALLSVALSDLGKPIEKIKPTPKQKQKSSEPIPSKQKSDPTSITQEIMLLGMTVDEAIETLDPYILAAQGQSQVLRIVHGKGTGALGRGIHSYLRTNMLVASYRYGRYGEGDNGVTIAELK